MTSALCSPTQIDLQNPNHRKIALEFQLKMLQLYGPSLGIYALPNLQDESVWSGIIFVRNGFYKDGKFRFDLHLEGFPLRQPRLYFRCRLHHALVNETTGELDVASVLAEPWNYCSQNMLYSLMKDLRKMFTDRMRLTNRFSLNPHMAGLLEGNLHEFIVKAVQSVSDSRESLHQRQEGCCFALCQPNEETDKIKEMLGEVVRVKDLKVEEKVEMFLKMFIQ